MPLPKSSSFLVWPTENSLRPSGWLPACALLLCVFVLMSGTQAFAVSRSQVHHVRHSPGITTRTHLSSRFHVRLRAFNPMFPGSHDLLVHQNEELDRMQLPRIADDFELTRFEVSQALVPVSESDALKIAADLPDNRRYCRPWTRDFLQDFSNAFYNEFHTPVQVNSLVRTVEQQHRLRRHNRFAAPEIGDTASTHLTGVTFDLSRRGWTPQQYQWVRSYLLPLKASGVVDPIEESQPVLHVVVFERYSNHFDEKNAWSEANEPTEMSFSSATAERQP
jgi:hypothetical protein